MVTSSYPRFPGDSIATFMEPIATGLAARGHAVHMIAPWHPRWARGQSDGGVQFHLYRYAPVPSMNIFGYAESLRADVGLRAAAVVAAPIALAAAAWRTRRVAARVRSSIVHAHWVIPSGALCAAVAGRRPLVISLHGSDVYVAERHAVVGRTARFAFRRAAWVTACSEDLKDRAVGLGADPARITVVPYGVDHDRYAPDASARARWRARLGIPPDAPVVLAFGRLVRKKGFEYLIQAAADLADTFPDLRVVIAGEGDLAGEFRELAASTGVADRVLFPGVVPQHEVPSLVAAADVAAVPSVRDEAGNVDGLPNTVLEVMASGTPLVATRAGGIGSVAIDGRSASLVPERDAAALAQAIAGILRSPDRGAALGRHARQTVVEGYGWGRVAEAFEGIYERISRQGPADGRAAAG
jgi:glycosyltransferase involved in cell wall biosynthesis